MTALGHEHDQADPAGQRPRPPELHAILPAPAGQGRHVVAHAVEGNPDPLGLRRVAAPVPDRRLDRRGRCPGSRRNVSVEQAVRSGGDRQDQRDKQKHGPGHCRGPRPGIARSRPNSDGEHPVSVFSTRAWARFRRGWARFRGAGNGTGVPVGHADRPTDRPGRLVVVRPATRGETSGVVRVGPWPNRLGGG